MGFNKQVLYFFLFSLTIFVQNSISETTDKAKTASVIVQKYNLTITTKSSHFTDQNKDEKFEGNVTIRFSTEDKDAEMISLDASSEIKINEVLLNDKKANYFKSENNKLNVSVKGLINNTNDLQINYSAPFGKDMTGIYRSSYKNTKNTNSWIVTSHFEPIFARNAFPCFDDPKQKAVFQLKVVIPSELKGYNVLSNTNCQVKVPKNEEGSQTQTYECEETPKMSTYLLAFTISDLKSTKKEEFQGLKKNITLNTYGQEKMIEYGGALSQKIAKEAILNLEKYLNEPYTLRKVDQVGIPDFSAGAMENWGLILFRETKLFFNEKRDSLLTKQSIILTIIHELVHQWFGNLVTLESWDYIWLNEAFATYFQYFIANEFGIDDPKIKEWETLKQQVVNEIHLRAFETDGLISSKSMSHKINDEKLIFSFFNDISYSKGSAVLRMWDLSLGQEKFKKGLQTYISHRKLNSANPSHLFNALKDECKMEKSFFDSWTNNPGYPVVTVVKGKVNYTLTQNRFLFEKPEKEVKIVYEIPITYYTSVDKVENKEVEFIGSKNLTIKVGKEKWIIVNKNQAGYYRVNYDENNWNALAATLREKPDKILELNRAQIINDIFSLARSSQKEYVKYTTALNLASYLKKEKSYIVWKTALHSFDFLRTAVFGDKKTNSYFESYLLDIITPHFKSLEVTTGSHTEILKEIEIARWACSLGFKNCTEEALKLYKKNVFAPNTKEIILCTAVRLDKNAFEEVLKLYTTETDNIYKNMYLNALGCSNNSTAIQELLNKTIKDSPEFRKQDLIYVMSSVINGNMNNVKTVFEFVSKNFKNISEKYGGIDPLGRALVGIAKKLNSESDLKEFKKLIENVKKEPSTQSSSENADIAQNIVINNVNWVKEKNHQIFSYFTGSGSVFSCSIGLLLTSLLIIFNF